MSRSDISRSDKSRSAPSTPTIVADAPVVRWVRFLVAGRIRLALLAAAIGLGLAFNWRWLAAIGVAPILLSILPCAVMCGLGLCMMGSGKGSCDRSASSSGADDRAAAELLESSRLQRPGDSSNANS